MLTVPLNTSMASSHHKTCHLRYARYRIITEDKVKYDAILNRRVLHIKLVGLLLTNSIIHMNE